MKYVLLAQFQEPRVIHVLKSFFALEEQNETNFQKP